MRLLLKLVPGFLIVFSLALTLFAQPPRQEEEVYRFLAQYLSPPSPVK